MSSQDATEETSEALAKKLLLAVAKESFDGDVEDFFDHHVLEDKADLLLDVAQSFLMAAAFESAAEQTESDSLE